MKPKPLKKKNQEQQQKSSLTGASAGLVKELGGPTLSVINVSQAVGSSPRLAVHSNRHAASSPGQRATDVGRIWAQGRAALLGQDPLHSAAHSRKLGFCSLWPAEQTKKTESQHSPHVCFLQSVVPQQEIKYQRWNGWLVPPDECGISALSGSQSCTFQLDSVIVETYVEKQHLQPNHAVFHLVSCTLRRRLNAALAFVRKRRIKHLVLWRSPDSRAASRSQVWLNSQRAPGAAPRNRCKCFGFVPYDQSIVCWLNRRRVNEINCWFNRV